MDIENMTDEQIKEYLNSRQQEKPSTPQFSGAIQDPTKYVGSKGLFQEYVDKANKSDNKGTQWQQYIEQNVTDPAAKADLESQIRAVIRPDMSPKELKYRLRAIEANLRGKYPNGVSKNFDISGGRFDSSMAKDLLALGINSDKKPASVQETEPKVEPKVESKVESKVEPKAEPKAKTNGKQVANSNKGVAGASVGDYIIRKDGTTHVITQADIDWAKKKVSTPVSSATSAKPVPSNTAANPAERAKQNAENTKAQGEYLSGDKYKDMKELKEGIKASATGPVENAKQNAGKLQADVTKLKESQEENKQPMTKTQVEAKGK